MPSSVAILDSLALVSDEWRQLAVAWHVVLALLVIAMWRRRPTRRTVAMAMIAPLVSVSALAWWSSNPGCR